MFVVVVVVVCLLLCLWLCVCGCVVVVVCLRSGREHLGLELAVEVRQGTLGVDGCG